ncbi:MAG TPA: VTT domain-containing protein [Chitinophagaceae bacterium]|nr:VTT domain-containing protein [Chitinophagaceae bacterium]
MMPICPQVQSFLSVFDVESLIRYGGLLIVFVAVYGQTGLFFCFFLPSGGLMFTAGVFVATGGLHQNLFTVCGLLIIASLLGNITGYWFGKKTGPLLYKREDSKFFKQEYLKTAERFYDRYGGMALTVGLFFPIVRTFAPILTGMIKMNFRKFIWFTFVGSVAWVLSFVLSGYLIARMPFLKPYLKYIIIAIIVFVTIPVVIRIVKEFRKPANKK